MPLRLIAMMLITTANTTAAKLNKMIAVGSEISRVGDGVGVRDGGKVVLGERAGEGMGKMVGESVAEGVGEDVCKVDAST